MPVILCWEWLFLLGPEGTRETLPEIGPYNLGVFSLLDIHLLSIYQGPGVSNADVVLGFMDHTGALNQ